MGEMQVDPRIWDARYFVYSYFAQNGRPPSIQETATGMRIPVEEARALYLALEAHHALVLMPGTPIIRMANPFSGVPTGFRVRVGAVEYYANCAWDAFGIPAALHADATINALCAQTHDPLRFQVKDNKVHGDNAVVFFRVPFARWYDDLVFT